MARRTPRLNQSRGRVGGIGPGPLHHFYFVTANDFHRYLALECALEMELFSLLADIKAHNALSIKCQLRFYYHEIGMKFSFPRYSALQA